MIPVIFPTLVEPFLVPLPEVVVYSKIKHLTFTKQKGYHRGFTEEIFASRTFAEAWFEKINQVKKNKKNTAFFLTPYLGTGYILYSKDMMKQDLKH